MDINEQDRLLTLSRLAALYDEWMDAEYFNVSLSGTRLTVVDKHGNSNTADLKGEPFRYEDFTPEEIAGFTKPATDAKEEWDNTYKPQAQQDHSIASSDHEAAVADHNNAVQDHNNATSDHNTAITDHNNALSDHDIALSDHNTSITQSGYAKVQADRAKAFNDNPWEIGEDGFIYAYDENTKKKVKTNKIIIDYSDLTEEQKQDLINHIVLDLASIATCRSIVDELT